MALRSSLGTVLTCIMTVLHLSAAAAQSPQESLWSEELLGAAVLDTGKLDHDQLEALIDYLAACGGWGESKDREFACERSRTILEIKTGLARALQRLVFTMMVFDGHLKANRNPPGREDRERLAKAVGRINDVFARLRLAAGRRYTCPASVETGVPHPAGV